MTLFIRIALMLVTAWRRPRQQTPLATTEIQLRVWPTDLDVFLHANNARYLTFFEIGRWDLLMRIGLHRTLKGGKLMVPVAAASVRFFKALHVFQKFTVRSHLGGIDERSAYIEQELVYNGEVHAMAIVRLALIQNGKRLSPADILKKFNVDPATVEMSDKVRNFVQLEEAMNRSRMLKE